MADPQAPRRVVIGAMSGTSMDAVDAVAATIDGTGLDMRARVARHVTRDLGSLRDDVRRAADQEPLTAGRLARLCWEIGGLYADAIADAATGLDRIDLIAVHGQTVHHQPPVSWQMINPAPIAARFGCPVVFDLRQMDLASGGQGAPITPLADWVVFRSGERPRVVVNLGGICNVTLLPAGDDAARLEMVRGFDVCACNQVLDEVARRALGAPYDAGGAAAGRGTSDARAADALHEILSAQRGAGRSLDRDPGPLAWVAGQTLAAEDLAATAVDAVARCIADALAEHEAADVLAAGGGAANATLIAAVSRHAGRPVRLTDELGVNALAREALAMAVLGALAADRVPVTLPQVTGAADGPLVGGSWYLP